MYFYHNETIRLNGRNFRVKLLLMNKNVQEGKYFGTVNITACVDDIHTLDGCRVALFGEATTTQPVEFLKCDNTELESANLYKLALEAGIIEKAKEDLINKINFMFEALGFHEHTHTELKKIANKLGKAICHASL